MKTQIYIKGILFTIVTENTGIGVSMEKEGKKLGEVFTEYHAGECKAHIFSGDEEAPRSIKF